MSKKALAATLSTLVVLGAGTAIVGAAQRGEESTVPGRQGIKTQSFSVPGDQYVDVSVEDIKPETLKLVGTSDRAAYFTATSSENMDCFIIRIIDAPDGEGRGCDPEKDFAERGTQTLTILQKDGTRVGGIRSYAPITAATRDSQETPVSGQVIPYTLEPGKSATIDLTTPAAKIRKTVP